MKRVVLIVLDSFGVGEMQDAHLFGDEGSNTMINIAKNSDKLDIPNMRNLGLGNIDGIDDILKVANPTGVYGKAKEQFQGKDTSGGHWEIAGLVIEKPFKTYPDGFPDYIMNEFEEKIGRNTLGNYASSGTVILDKLGKEHMETGFPIVYTSADSVFQIACHEDIIPIDEQYRICQIARDMLVGDDLVGRVIARPFTGDIGTFKRTERRKDYSVTPMSNTVLDLIKNAGKKVFAIGKIEDIFNRKGITYIVHSTNNEAGIEATIEAIKTDFEGLIFTNLVDFDMLYGHRNNVDGYAKALSAYDKRLPEIMASLKDDDLLIMTADHGCDPTTPSTDHSREHIPILATGKNLAKNVNLATRSSFGDIAATIAQYLEIDYDLVGESFLDKII